MLVEQGLIQVYTGTGKGKTTAALGLAVRALGQGLRVLLVRFLKAEHPPSGEILFLANSPGLDILTAGVGGIRQGQDREGLRRSVTETFTEMKRRLAMDSYDLVVLDEINGVLRRDLLELGEFLQFLDKRAPGTELVLTGRDALPEVLERAHLVTRMDKVKHPLDQGIGARRGMEY
ncbi:cob(I)yrinic acid a,c-diamide adenosyltransferase [Geoalkalibacter sp.]|uniref:cob(I)yrinic acid a,c-diamide adenosyltransferase n=1 Tax=Geoalkalibacter sp. TaxID=3041440 RepID=UPI00272E3A68|nr:cob(I)yrinic acid a,c-diamide adenosyltransferase [Geoalkalibacter sp.]